MTADNQGFGGDTLYYAHWDGVKWTEPVDVLVSPQGGAEFPNLTVSPDGTLHAVWDTGGITGRALYAQAPACCASDARNWSKPFSLGAPVATNTAIVADDRGHIHAAFAASDTNTIVYRRSDDGGKTWPVSVEIPGGATRGDETLAYVRLAVDKHGRVHAAWTIMPWPGRAVMYARSEDGGNIWQDPQVIDRYTDGYAPDYGPMLINVQTRGENEVHLIWDGAPTVERTHVWSADGGVTWSAHSKLFPEVRNAGRAGWNDMAVDSAGVLHAVSLGGPLHATWDGTRWSASEKLVTTGPVSTGGERLRLAISLGNTLHAIWIKKDVEPNTVWYVRAETGAPRLMAQPLPVPLPMPSPTITTPAIEPTHVISDASSQSVIPSVEPLSSIVLGSPAASTLPMLPLVVGVGGSVAFLLFAILLGIWHQSRTH